jgi:hypothetical protein
MKHLWQPHAILCLCSPKPSEIKLNVISTATRYTRNVSRHVCWYIAVVVWMSWIRFLTHFDFIRIRHDVESFVSGVYSVTYIPENWFFFPGGKLPERDWPLVLISLRCLITWSITVTYFRRVVRHVRRLYISISEERCLVDFKWRNLSKQ